MPFNNYYPDFYTATILECRPCTFMSDFGTGLTNPPAVYSYMAGREATFYQALICSIGQPPMTVAQTLMSNMPPGKSKFYQLPKLQNRNKYK